MSAHIVLTEEQLRVLAEAKGPVEVRDGQGRTLATVTPFDPGDVEVIERWKRRRDQPQKPGIPAAQVEAHLRRLAEIREREGMDEAKILDLLRRMQAGEQV